MKTYEQVRDILNRVRGFHRRLRDELGAARPGVRDARTEFVLELLSRDEQTMNLALGTYDPQDTASPLEIWIQYVPDDEMQRLLDEAQFTSEMTPEEVLARKEEIDGALMEFYRQIAEQASARRVVELFEQMAGQTEQRQKDEAWQFRESETAPKDREDSERRRRPEK